MEVNPLSIILVKSDSKGDRLLFRYPFNNDTKSELDPKDHRKNPYSLTISEDMLQSPLPHTSNIFKGNLTGLSDEVMSTLFAVKPELCHRKFELKVNDVRFVGHPTLCQAGCGFSSSSVINGSVNHSDASTILIHVVFALHASASHSIVKCYYDLSKRLGIALRHEEKRCCYVTEQTKIMIAAHDEVAMKISEKQTVDLESPFEIILNKSPLSTDLRTVYEDITSTGLVHIRVNKWIEVSFCLPHKVHQTSYLKKGFMIEPESIDNCLQSVRPYHGILLLVERNELLDSFPPDASPALQRLVQVYSPLKSLQTLAADADVTLEHVFQLTGHLVYWAKAMVIYPICENNIYVIAPESPTSYASPLLEKFSEKFPGESLFQIMSDFSLPTSLSQKLSPLISPQQQQLLVQMIAWLLQHRLLLQLHTYVHLMPTNSGHPIDPKSEKNPSTPNTHSKNTSAEEIFKPKLKNDFPNFKSSADSFISTENDKKSLLQKQLLETFTEEEKEAILKVPASSNLEDLSLLVRLYKKGYLTGKNHINDIMYFENITRSQLLQVLDKFSEILITCEIEQSVINMFYSHNKSD